MTTEKELRSRQRRRENEQYKRDFELFGESSTKNNPITNDTAQKRGFSIWEKELRPFFAEKINSIPEEISKNIKVKFKALGSSIADEDLKIKYKNYIQKFLSQNVRLLIYLTLKTAIELYVYRSNKDIDLDYVNVIDKIGRVFHSYVSFYDSKSVLVEALAGVGKVDPASGRKVSSFVDGDFNNIAGYFLDCVVMNQSMICRDIERNTRESYRLIVREEIARCYDPKKNEVNLFNPTKLPMVSSPNDWDSSLVGGGYLTRRSDTLVSVKSKKQLSIIRESIKNGENEPIFLKAVNKLQRVAWRINPKILEVLDFFYSSPSSLVDNLSAKYLLAQTFKLARDFESEVFYIPWYLDFRGRMYASVTPIGPQSWDEGRSLLLFATPQAIQKSDEDKVFVNLAVHGFNKYKPKTGKLSMQEMVSWIEGNESEIIKAAIDPLKNQEFWQDASDKYSFLAFCFEWNQIKNSSPNARSTNLPVYVDGTCNGFQHYAALLRDENVAPFVNLVDAEVSGDLYQAIADRLRTAVVSPRYDSFVKQFVDNYIDRRSVKKSIISAGYGSGIAVRSRATSRYFYDSLPRQKRPDDAPAIDPSEMIDEEGKNTAFLLEAGKVERLINRAIKNMCPSFVQITSWLKKTNRLVSAKGHSIGWETSSGFFVQTPYYVYPTHEARIFLGNKSAKILFADFNSTKKLEVDSRKSSRSIAPNFIHSFDAAHAAHIVTSFTNRYPNDHTIAITAVHDSFATHATHVGDLQESIRETFFNIYSENQLELFKSQVETRFGITAPDLPEMGKLDISKMLNSKYFFC